MGIEHPSITRTLKTGYPEKEPVAYCDHCEEPIFKGQDVWQKGSDRFCNLKCLHESMYGPNKEEDKNE